MDVHNKKLYNLGLDNRYECHDPDKAIFLYFIWSKVLQSNWWVTMGSLLGPTLANTFLCYDETTWLKNCPKSFKPVYYKRYVDNIFVLFEKP